MTKKELHNWIPLNTARSKSEVNVPFGITSQEGKFIIAGKNKNYEVDNSGVIHPISKKEEHSIHVDINYSHPFFGANMDTYPSIDKLNVGMAVNSMLKASMDAIGTIGPAFDNVFMPLHMSSRTILDSLKDFDSISRFNELLELTQLSQNILSNDIFELTPKTFSKYKTVESKIPSRIAELTIKIEGLYKEGIDIFGSAEDFNSWLKEPSFGLDNQIPIKLLNTGTGIDLVSEELLKIGFGATA